MQDKINNLIKTKISKVLKNLEGKDKCSLTDFISKYIIYKEKDDGPELFYTLENIFGELYVCVYTKRNQDFSISEFKLITQNPKYSQYLKLDDIPENEEDEDDYDMSPNEHKVFRLVEKRSDYNIIDIEKIKNKDIDFIYSVIESKKFQSCKNCYELKHSDEFDENKLCIECYKKLLVNHKLFEKDLCTICQDDDAFNFKCKTKCGHVFHKECLNKWIESTRNCPFCRSKDIGYF